MRRIIFWTYLIYPIYILCVEKIRYISVEHPAVENFNPKYLRYFNLTAQRYGRKNPVYYVGVHFYLVRPWDNNVLVDFYFYEFLSNVYKRSFVEMHYKWCDLIAKDKFFGAPMKQGKLTKPCPHLPGAYDCYNMTVPPTSLPKSFPFRKGRICCNVTHAKTKENIGYGHIDMEIKEVKRTTDKITFSDNNNNN